MFGEELAKKPAEVRVSLGLVRAWLHQGEVSQAAAQLARTMGASGAGRNAELLAARAEVELKQGQPWAALETLKQAEAVDPCNARAHLIRGKALRLDSMYAGERSEIQKAYDIDPTDSDIRHAWMSVVMPAHEIESLHESMVTTKDLDEETRRKAQESIDEMLPLVLETSQTCKVLPGVVSAVVPLQAVMTDAKHVEGYRLDAKLGREASEARLRLNVDTAASGVFITRAMATQYGLEQRPGDPAGTVRAERLVVGSLEFRDCLVGVSEGSFGGKTDGFIGTDIFSQYLITLDHRKGELRLDPLPVREAALPGDRLVAPELRGFTPVYRRQQYLLMPVMLNNRMKRMFVLDSGSRLTAMRPEVAHAVSSTKVNFTNAVQTVSGGTVEIYRDSFDFAYADLTVGHQGHVLQMDSAAMDRNAGFEVAGLLGFDMLHAMVMHLDYRDGLVKLEGEGSSAGGGGGALTAGVGNGGAAGLKSAAECRAEAAGDRPIGSTIEAQVTNMLDAGQLKPGGQFYVRVKRGWQDPECTLVDGALLYGHAVAASGKKGMSEMSLVFDRGDCEGQARKPISLRVIGLIGAPDQVVNSAGVMPSQLSGGGRNISVAVRDLNGYSTNLNPGGSPNTVHAGIVVGLEGMKLEPGGGVGCSDRISSAGRTARLGVGSELVFSRE